MMRKAPKKNVFFLSWQNLIKDDHAEAKWEKGAKYAEGGGLGSPSPLVLVSQRLHYNLSLSNNYEDLLKFSTENW